MEYNSFMEALKGKQKKLDKNHNGEIDSQDLKIVRNEETEELDEIHRMKTKLNKLDPISNRSVARQKLSNLMKSGKARGALIANKMRTLNMGDDVDQEDLDALHEVLSKDATASDWIHDFVHSDNPKFEGKSKKERIKMALGAYYDTNKKKDGVSEGYQSYSGRSHGNPYGGGGFGRREREDDEYHVPDPVPSRSHAPVAPVPAKKYIRGTPENQALRASRKPINGHPTNEETVQEDKMTTTKDKSGKLISFKYEGDWKKSTEKKQGSGKAANLAGQALKKMQEPNEEYISQEEYNNLSLDEQALYERTEKSLGKRAADMHNAASHIGYGDNGGSSRKEMSSAKKDFRKIGKSIAKTHGKDVAKQAGDAAHDNAFMGNASAGASDGSHKKFYSSLPDKEKKAYTTRNQHHGLEEAKDAAEYDQEGDMAKTQLRSIKYHADELHEMLSDNDNLPEWVQSKLTLAQDYLQTVCDYMYSKDEVNEGAQYAGLEKEDKPGKVKTAVVKLHPKGVESETVEGWKDPKKPVAEAVQKVDIPAYLRKAKGDTPLKMSDLKRKDTISDPENLKKNRLTDSFDNEGNLISNKISYKDFITEIKLADLPVRRIQGHSYGANYSDPEGADDYDDKKPMKPAAEKRGRGRPAGAKSGARKITGTSKLMNK